MKKLLLFIACILSLQIMAQQSEQSRMQGRNMPKPGKIYGSIRDAETNQPVSFASVAVMLVRDSSLVGGVQSNEKGNFLIDEIPFGKVILKISFIGYANTFSDIITINPQNTEVDAGVIKVHSSSVNLKTVTVSGEKSEVVNSIDRKVYNMDKNIVNTGGTVTEVLQNIPSVSVDIDGKVSLRGNENVTILIDGKPSGILGGDRKAVLQQIPAGAVEQIEVITNPSAKYDATGMSGIINIKTKKEKMKGMNGNISVGAGTHDKYNLSVGGNNRTPRTNLYFSYNYRHESRDITGENTQYNFFPGVSPYYYHSATDGTNMSDVHSGKLGSDFYINKYNTLSLSAGLTTRNEEHPEEISYLFYYPDNTAFNSFTRDNTEDSKNLTYDINSDYKKTWSNSDRMLTASISYSQNKRNDDNTYMSSLNDLGEIPFQINKNENTYQNILAQADLVQPFKNGGKLETGVKSSNRFLDNILDYSDYNSVSHSYDYNSLLSDHFIYNEQIAAAYAMYTGKVKKFEYNAGLRAEETISRIDSRTMNQVFDNDYLSLFPSAFLKYTLNTKNEFQISYSRRVNRPESRALNPFVDYSDSLNIRKGNPFLKPEFVHSMELAYSKYLNALTISTTVYYRRTDDMISRNRTVDAMTGIATMTTLNFSSAENTGAELILRYNFDKLGSIMTSFNVFQNKVNGTNVNSEYQTNTTQWNGRFNANMRVAKNTSIQLTANYMAPMKTVSGEIKGMSGVDAGLKQDFWSGKGSLSLNVSDIFKTRKFQMLNTGEYYVMNGWRSRESRVAMLNFTYKFGKADSNLFRNKRNQKMNSMPDSGGDVMDY